ncbi:bifunctional UDP-N-acetylglucosamine diphosphorylase/glucosamine-1-phosphate N-acetyltransferase GlmU [Gammaproteobacteria bacterium]|nr:bifunctional UDP-N-acetylglucosamine diphosphorylase/glucosamine-1-phosphate N-acetyltransferase GlmU [Gammaproteobacteria bacterium]MDA8957688.1 bifunctional UDP-N-acetylglucosamine diphosphorylase/glucosamine-1-phosphate N-acetyltransferase GlmU [Gammaproteobacteria bacterium]MDA9038704.1 bifunctional UDP-N-acetylglucosamine diphosphorylase/glucosamine-1-phosphate N-acetyltransferase GlmU [Gammaproteobacteria bacterium]MDA9044270.1 bifunctional UDP-N-acetylglucosamine diphosphorylase/glucos
MNIHTIILAAGEGSRMNSNRAKSLQQIGGTSMLEKICNTAGKITKNITLVVGYDKESIINEAKKLSHLNITTSLQPRPIGTGDAVKCGLDKVSDNSKVLVLYGDVPLIKEDTLNDLISASTEGASILTTVLENPFGYGRVKKNKDGHALSIVEEKDASESEREIKQVFTGVLCVDKDLLAEGLSEIKNENAANEFYLTDLVSIMNLKGVKINTCDASNEEVQGANNKKELERLETIYRSMKTEELFDLGITVIDASRLDVRGTVEAGKDCTIDVNVILEGEVVLGNNVYIGPNTILKDVHIGDGSRVEAFSHLVSAKVGEKCVIGPYARLREGSDIKNLAKVGNFVETKNTTLGEGSKANHFTYLGDTNVGTKTNIGAGTITCNYDGTNKHKTIIGDNSFIGSNSSLVAPVEIGNSSTIAAGSVITKNVPEDALGVGRSKQTNKDDWSKKKD